MEQKQIDEIKARLKNVIEYGVTGFNTAMAVHKYYCEDLPLLIEALEDAESRASEFFYKFNESEVENKRMQSEFQKYKQTEAEGRLVELPCKVGDTVYEIINVNVDKGVNNKLQPIGKNNKLMTISNVKKRVIKNIIIGNPYGIKLKTGYCEEFMEYRIGKTIFLTREEAETVLKAQEERT